MKNVPAALRREVIRRAEGRCEYCRLAQASEQATFHIDHITPRAAGGATASENLALACASCSLRKGARQTAVDPATGERVSVYHPRRQRWQEHFRWDGLLLVGHTPSGRATVMLLKLNTPQILELRREEASRGRHPPRPPRGSAGRRLPPKG
jgi:hypothetical protein